MKNIEILKETNKQVSDVYGNTISVHKQVCSSCCRQCYVATYEANICPKSCACHMTNQCHQISFTIVGT